MADLEELRIALRTSAELAGATQVRDALRVIRSEAQQTQAVLNLRLLASVTQPVKRELTQDVPPIPKATQVVERELAAGDPARAIAPAKQMVTREVEGELPRPQQTTQDVVRTLAHDLPPVTTASQAVERHVTRDVDRPAATTQEVERTVGQDVPPLPLAEQVVTRILSKDVTALPPQLTQNVQRTVTREVGPPATTTQDVVRSVSRDVGSPASTTQAVERTLANDLPAPEPARQSVSRDLQAGTLPAVPGTTQAVRRELTAGELPPPARATQDVVRDVVRDAPPPTTATQAVQRQVTRDAPAPQPVTQTVERKATDVTPATVPPVILHTVADTTGANLTRDALRQVRQEAEATQQALTAQQQLANSIIRQSVNQGGVTAANLQSLRDQIQKQVGAAPTLTGADLGITGAPRAAAAAAEQHAQAVRGATLASRDHTAAANETARAQLGLGNSFNQSSGHALRFAGQLLGLNSIVNLVQNVLSDGARAALDFGASIASVGAISDASASQLAKLSDLARSSGKDLGIGPAEGAKGLQELIKGGVSTEAALGGALRATELLAKAGGVDLASAAEISATALNAFGLSASQLAHVADLVAGASNASSIGVEDFRQSLAQAGAVARTSGVSFEETAVAIAELGQAGIKGSDAGTSLRTFLLSLTPTAGAATDALRQLGIITQDGTNRFFDASGKAKNFADIQQLLNQALVGYNDQQKTAILQTIFGTDALRAAAVFSRQGAAGFDALAAAMGKVSAATVAAKQTDSLRGDLDKLRAAADNAAVSLEKAFDPALRAGAQGITGALSDIQRREEELASFQRKVAIARQEILDENAKLPFGGLRPETLGAIDPLIQASAQTRVSEHPERFVDFVGVQNKATAAALANEQLATQIAAVGAAARTAGPSVERYGQTFNIVDQTLQRTRRSLADVAKDITDLQPRTSALSSIGSALSPQDTGLQAQVQALQDIQTIDARINAQRAAAAIDEERRREREATKITDPRDAAGANAARERGRLLDELLPKELAVAEARRQQAAVSDAITAAHGAEAAAVLQVLDKRQEVARLERDIADSVDRGLQLRQEETRLLAQQSALRPNNALDDTQAQIQRDKLLLNVRGQDVETRRAARVEIRDLSRNVLPGQELDAFDANRQVTKAQRAETATSIDTQLRQNPIQQQIAALQLSARSGERMVFALEQTNERLNLLGQVAAAITAAAEKKVQVVLSGDLNLAGFNGNGPMDAITARSIAEQAASLFEDRMFGQLTEANAQAQLPPAIPQSGVRR